MSDRVLQRLLTSGQYDQFEDVILVESKFVELDKSGNGIRQVIMGLTPENLLVAAQDDYKIPPEVYCRLPTDPYTAGVELLAVLPIFVVQLTMTTNADNILTVTVGNKQRRFQLATGCSRPDVWRRWREQADYLGEDTYGYIKSQCDKHGLPYPAKSGQSSPATTLRQSLRRRSRRQSKRSGSVSANSAGNRAENSRRERNQTIYARSTPGKKTNEETAKASWPLQFKTWIKDKYLELRGRPPKRNKRFRARTKR